MTVRVLRWLGWGLLLALTPLVCTLGFRAYQQQALPSLGQLLGSGQGLLISVTWLAASLREMRDTPSERSGARDFFTMSAVLSLIASSAAYGFISARVLGGVPQSTAQSTQVAIVSLVLMTLSAIVSSAAVAIGTAKSSER